MGVFYTKTIQDRQGWDDEMEIELTQGDIHSKGRADHVIT